MQQLSLPSRTLGFAARTLSRARPSAASALQPEDDFAFVPVALGLTLFYAISTLYGLALACVLTDSPRRFASAIGIAFGLALYSANFHGFTHLFPWFSELRTIDTIIAHALYGLLLARAYCAFRHTD